MIDKTLINYSERTKFYKPIAKLLSPVQMWGARDQTPIFKKNLLIRHLPLPLPYFKQSTFIQKNPIKQKQKLANTVKQQVLVTS